jgi:hypothetical protein
MVRAKINLLSVRMAASNRDIIPFEIPNGSYTLQWLEAHIILKQIFSID